MPGFAAGVLGLAAGMIGLGLDNPTLGVVAGVLALAAGVAGIRLAQDLHEQAAVQSLIEDELRNVRAEAKDTEQRLQQEQAETASLSGGELASEGDDEVDALLDSDTGLFSESFFNVALDSRIAVARRHLRPVAVVLLEVVDGLPTSDPVATAADKVAVAVQETLREADTACRMRNGVFALLLEDTPENGAIWTVERIRRSLAGDTGEDSTMWAGIACYPAHAFGSEEIVAAAETALVAAREWRQDRIEVAAAAAD